MKDKLLTLALTLMVVGCSQEPATPEDDARVVENRSDGISEIVPTDGAEGGAESLTRSAFSETGFGGLELGRAVPAESDFKVRGAQESDQCMTISSPGHPGVYAIVQEDEVRRITIGQRSNERLATGVGIGSSEQEVRAAYPDLVEAPHKYIDAPGKYLTSATVSPTVPGVRFEIGADQKVSLIHMGISPQLEYVEGCS